MKQDHRKQVRREMHILTFLLLRNRWAPVTAAEFGFNGAAFVLENPSFPDTVM